MAQDIRPWTDLYSVGCMAFEMFTGRSVPRLRRADGDPAAARQRADPRREVDRPERRPAHLGLDREAAGQGRPARSPPRMPGTTSRRSSSRCSTRAGAAPPAWARRPAPPKGPNPYAGTPFQGTSAGAAASDEFQSFAWGQPAADTAETARPRRPPKHAAAAGPAIGADGGGRLPRRRRHRRGLRRPEAPAAPGGARRPRRGLRLPHVRGARAVAPHRRAVSRRPPGPRPSPPRPTPSPSPREPAPQAEGDRGGRARRRLRDLHRPRRRRARPRGPGTDALQGCPGPRAAGAGAGRARARGRPAAAPTRRPSRRAARAEPLPEPPARADPGAPAAAYDYDPNATVMPESLRQKPEAKPKKERKPKADKPPGPPRRPARAMPEERKAFPIALAAGARDRAPARLPRRRVGRRRRGGAGRRHRRADPARSPPAPPPVKTPSDWSELSTPRPVPGLSLSDPKAASPSGKDGGLAVLVGIVKKAPDNSTLLAAVPAGRRRRAGAQRRGPDRRRGRAGLPLRRAQAQRLRPRGDRLRGADVRRRDHHRVPRAVGRRRLVRVDVRPMANTLELSSGDRSGRPQQGLQRRRTARRSARSARPTSPARQAQVGCDAAAQAAAAKSLAKAYRAPAADARPPGPEPGRPRRQRAAGQGAAPDGRRLWHAASAASRRASRRSRRRAAEIADGREAVASALAGLKAAGYDVAS